MLSRLVYELSKTMGLVQLSISVAQTSYLQLVGLEKQCFPLDLLNV